jgi:3-polyprenyl-4-hydroxybenzoate decarboxylase
VSLPLVLAITGASGAPYAVRLLELLARQEVPTWLIVSGHGLRLLESECGIGSIEALEAATEVTGAASPCFPTATGARSRLRARSGPAAW